MSEIDDIEISLASFIRHLGDTTSRYSELRKCSFFDPIPNEYLETISRLTQIRTFAAGEKLTREGDPTNTFYVVLLGTTTVYCNEKRVGKISYGECIGEGTFFNNQNISRSATVIADEQVVVAELDRTSIEILRREAKVKEYMDRALMIALFKKLQGANQRIQELL
jgi:signal-transduction protein with cAMP-binding, CBS, and nucleotidyltransferase domain